MNSAASSGVDWSCRTTGISPDDRSSRKSHAYAAAQRRAAAVISIIYAFKKEAGGRRRQSGGDLGFFAQESLGLFDGGRPAADIDHHPDHPANHLPQEMGTLDAHQYKVTVLRHLVAA